MSIECKNCKVNPATDSKIILTRLNHKGVIGEWICQNCSSPDGLTETFKGNPHCIHSPSCSNYCDYACNGESGFDLAEQVLTYPPENLPTTEENKV